MATQAELEIQRGWAQQVRVASTWLSGPYAQKLSQLADQIDPDVTELPVEPPVDSPGIPDGVNSQ